MNRRVWATTSRGCRLPLPPIRTSQSAIYYIIGLLRILLGILPQIGHWQHPICICRSYSFFDKERLPWREQKIQKPLCSSSLTAGGLSAYFSKDKIKNVVATISTARTR